MQQAEIEKLFSEMTHAAARKLPYKSALLELLLEKLSQPAEEQNLISATAILIQALTEARRYEVFALECLVTLDSAICTIRTVSSDRYFQYQALQKNGLKDKIIFQQMFEAEEGVSAEADSEGFRKFCTAMRVFKSKHKKWFLPEFKIKPAVFKNRLREDWQESTCENDDDCETALKDLLATHDKRNAFLADKLRKLQSGTEEDQEAHLGALFHEIIQLFEQEAEINWKHADLYEKGLIYAGQIQFLLSPQDAGAISSLTLGLKEKSLYKPRKENAQADIHRAMASAYQQGKGSTDYFPDQHKSFRRTFLKWEQHSEFILSPEQQRQEDILEEINRRKLAKRQQHSPKRQIETWADVIALLRSLDPVTPDAGKVLEQIFLVCAQRRDWKNPEEISLSAQFSYWESLGFFHLLRRSLKKGAYISQIQEVWWRKINQKMIAGYPLSLGDARLEDKWFSPR